MSSRSDEIASSDLTPMATVRGQTQSRAFLPAFLLGYFGLNLALLPASGISVPLRIDALDPLGKGLDLAVVTAVGGIVVLVATPLFGRMSDRSTSRFGMRRPFILGGVITGGAGLVLLSFAQDIATLIIAWAVVQAGFAAASSASLALMSDQIPTRIRGRVSAAWGLASTLALLVGSQLISLLPPTPAFWFIIPAIVAVLMNVFLVAVLRDIVRTRRAPAFSPRVLLSSYWVNPLRHPDFGWAWLCRLLVTMSVVSVTTFMLYFLTDELQVPSSSAASTVGVALVLFFFGGMLTLVIFGWVSDRTGRRKVIVCSSALLTAVGVGIMVVSPSLSVLFVGIAIAGMGQGAYLAVDVALMTEVLPSTEDAGKDLGVVAVAYLLPQLLVPLISIPLLAIAGGDNYRALFAGAVVMAILGGLAVLPVRSVR